MRQIYLIDVSHMSYILAPLIDQLGASKADVAKAVGLSRAHLYRVMSGKSEPTAPAISRVLLYLNTPENLRKLDRRKPITFEELFGSSSRAA